MADKYKERCRHCAALVQGATPKDWVCDEKGCDVHQVKVCPEGRKL